ncbi:uncharacterized protein LOC132264971 [Phlebotomus argentipes]|uniref:uncharacterized protein LOC132264971 n=1 Tax=Phlebotomus argentipes TaxID=94469 RepID=UPI002892DAAE|nr:uncharacterized protein LOC132264971 [Phlebotomus argentipes]
MARARDIKDGEDVGNITEATEANLFEEKRREHLEKVALFKDIVAKVKECLRLVKNGKDELVQEFLEIITRLVTLPNTDDGDRKTLTDMALEFEKAKRKVEVKVGLLEEMTRIFAERVDALEASMPAMPENKDKETSSAGSSERGEKSEVAAEASSHDAQN